MILLLDGSLGAPDGNTSRLAQQLSDCLRPAMDVRHHTLRESLPSESLLREAKAFVFVTGTYWDSWGSPLQRFLEDSTRFEGSDLWLGKPAAILVTMHSVGGKEILSRLQGVLSSLGLLIPPMSGMVYSLANHLALRAGGDEDFWRPDDLKIIAHNLLVATGHRKGWRRWPVEHDFQKIWI